MPMGWEAFLGGMSIIKDEQILNYLYNPAKYITLQIFFDEIKTTLDNN